MPKFYSGEECGISYEARAIGWRRIFPFSLLPYLTGNKIPLYFSMKRRIEAEWWQQGILRIEPPIMSDEPLWKGGPLVPLSDYAFEIEKMQVGQRWSTILFLKGGASFAQPCNIECHVDFQNIKDGKQTLCSVKVADIEVVSRGPFLTTILMWIISLIVAGLIGYFINALT